MAGDPPMLLLSMKGHWPCLCSSVYGHARDGRFDVVVGAPVTRQR
jgi:hypothetical protein